MRLLRLLDRSIYHGVLRQPQRVQPLVYRYLCVQYCGSSMDVASLQRATVLLGGVRISPVATIVLLPEN